MRRHAAAALFPFFLFLSGLNASDSAYEQGLKAYNEKNYQSALKIWDVAAKQGSPEANNGIGFLLQHGLGIVKNPTAALGRFREAAQNGYGPAEFNLGLAYHQGLGIAKNDAEATTWLELAASHGVPLAELSLGNIAYAGGTGDIRKALRWWQLAAEHGVGVAGANAGYIYAEGKGIPQDYREASRWYQLGANQGNAQAQYALGLLYQDGKGVKQDATLSAKWLNMASRGKPSNTSATRAVLVSRDDTPVFHKVGDVGPANSWAGPTASGVVVGEKGYVITSLQGHGCANWSMKTEANSSDLKFIASDEANQITVLSPASATLSGLPLRTRISTSGSEQVVSVGFDLNGAQAIRNAVSGSVQSGEGRLQLHASKTVPSQGGAVLDSHGSVIGLALPGNSGLESAVLPAKEIASFLDSKRVAFTEGDGQGIEQARKSVVLVECKN